MAEQTATGRTLSYGLDDKLLTRVKGATEATAKVDAEKDYKKTSGIIDRGISTVMNIGGAMVAGKAITEANEAKWDAALSKGLADGVWGTTSSMEDFRDNVVSGMQADYIAAVRLGDKGKQEALLSQLNTQVESLKLAKEHCVNMAEDKANIGFKTNVNSFSLADQDAAAQLAENEHVTRVIKDGVLVHQIDQSQVLVDALGAVPPANVAAGRSESHVAADKARAVEELMASGNFILKDKSGQPVLVEDMGQIPQETLDKLLKGDITLTREFNAEEIKKLGDVARKPVDIIKDVTGMLDEIQTGASDPKNPTYFDYQSINNSIQSGISPEDITSFIYEDIGAGSVFAEDFIYNPALDMPVVVGFEKYDGNKDGVLSPAEQKGDINGDGTATEIPITLTPENKVALIKEMSKPENAAIAIPQVAEWLTMKAYGKWKDGVGQRQEEVTMEDPNDPTKTITTSRLVNTDFTNKETGESVYGGVVDPNDPNKMLKGKYYEAGAGVLGQTMATTGVGENVQFGGNSRAK